MKRRNFVTAAIASVGSLFLSKAEGRTPIVTAIRPKSPTRDDECKILRAWIIGDQPKCVSHERRDTTDVLTKGTRSGYSSLHRWEYKLAYEPLGHSSTVFFYGRRIPLFEKDPVEHFDKTSKVLNIPEQTGFRIQGDRLFITELIASTVRIAQPIDPVSHAPIAIVDYMVDCD